LAALIFELSEGQQNGFASLPTVVALVGGVFLAAGLVVTERPALWPELLAHPPHKYWLFVRAL
jgi:hypothetical protein